MKHITDLLVPSGWERVGNDQSIADYISGHRKAINIGQKLAEKETLGLKCITANLFSCTLQENYMCLLAPYESKHPLKISTHSCC